MRRLVVSRSARRDLDAVLRYSETTFGPVASARYARLVDVAYHDIQAAPDGPLMKSIPGLVSGVRIYHLKHSIRRVPPSERVKRPSHVVAFRFDATTVAITDLLHEAMDLPTRLR